MFCPANTLFVIPFILTLCLVRAKLTLSALFTLLCGHLQCLQEDTVKASGQCNRKWEKCGADSQMCEWPHFYSVLFGWPTLSSKCLPAAERILSHQAPCCMLAVWIMYLCSHSFSNKAKCDSDTGLDELSSLPSACLSKHVVHLFRQSSSEYKHIFSLNRKAYAKTKLLKKWLIRFKKLHDGVARVQIKQLFHPMTVGGHCLSL